MSSPRLKAICRSKPPNKLARENTEKEDPMEREITEVPDNQGKREPDPKEETDPKEAREETLPSKKEKHPRKEPKSQRDRTEEEVEERPEKVNSDRTTDLLISSITINIIIMLSHTLS